MDLQATSYRPSGRTVIIGCSATKSPGIDLPDQARWLYTGSFFQLCHAAAAYLTPLDRVLVLSARYGLVSLNQTIEPYDLRMGQPGSTTADQVRAQATTRGLLDGEEIVVLAGRAYAEIACAVWPHAHFPLAGCHGIGEQRARLAALVNDRRWRGTCQLPASMWEPLTPDEQAAYWLHAEPPSTSLIGADPLPDDDVDVEELLATSDEEIRERAAALEPAVYPGVRAFPQPVYLSGVDNPALRNAAAGDWRLGLMVQPGNATALSTGAYHWFAADNGCYSQGGRFDPAAWLGWVARLPRDTCIFVVAPDVWGDHAATLRRAEPWLDRVRLLGSPVALVAQDGLQPTDVPWERIDCLMVGGTDPWRASPAVPRLLAAAQREEKWTHLGRVNSARRLRWAASLGFDSADGTYLAFGPDTNLPRLLGWLDSLACGTQQMLPLDLATLGSGGSRSPPARPRRRCAARVAVRMQTDTPRRRPRLPGCPTAASLVAGQAWSRQRSCPEGSRMDLPEIHRPDDAAALIRLVAVDFDPDRPARHYTTPAGRPRFTPMRCS